jgi:Ca2+-transporting ATPase
MAEICAVCNDAGIFCDGRLFRATGLPTEAALKVLVEKMGVPDAKAREKIRDMQLAANYLIDRSTVKLGKQKPEHIYMMQVVQQLRSFLSY